MLSRDRFRVLTGAVALALLASCGRTSPAPPISTKLTVAAATNLTDAFRELGSRFTKKTGVEVVFSFGSTAQLAQQIENGAPFDVFAAADTEHVDQLVERNFLVPKSRTVYARGRLALWFPKAEAGNELADLSKPQIRVIAIASPSLAPYGQAAVEYLKATGLWDEVQSKVVYANSISMAKQYASTGNADAALTAYALVFGEKGRVIRLDEKLHQRIEQGLAILSSSKQRDAAQLFLQFVLKDEGRSTLQEYGYELP